MSIYEKCTKKLSNSWETKKMDFLCYPQFTKLSTEKSTDFHGKIKLFTELSTLSTINELWMNCGNTKFLFCGKRKKRQKSKEILDFLVV